MKLLVSLFALALAQPAFAGGINPMATGQAMAWQCAPCHGTNGQQFLEAMPPLAGMPIKQFTKAMLDYREGNRPAVIMDRVARGFNDEEIHAMAVWFEQQPVKSWEETGLNESVAAQNKGNALNLNTGGQ